MGLSMGLVSSWMPSMWIALILALTVAALKSSSIGASTDTGLQMGCLVYSLWLI